MEMQLLLWLLNWKNDYKLQEKNIENYANLFENSQ